VDGRKQRNGAQNGGVRGELSANGAVYRVTPGHLGAIGEVDMSPKHRLALLAALLLPLAAQAQTASTTRQSGYTARGPAYAAYPLSYTHGELRLVVQDPDGRDDADGVSLAGSVLVQPQVFIAGGYSSVGSGGFNGVDADTLEIAAGFRHPYTSQVDLIAMAGIVHVDLDVGNRHDDDVGPSLTGGTRIALSNLVEIAAYANYSQVFGDGDLGLRGEGLYHFTPNFSALAGVGISDDDRTANVGARWYFVPIR
jgi:hypothetical protein